LEWFKMFKPLKSFNSSPTHKLETAG
jgi:hypothetical protein